MLFKYCGRCIVVRFDLSFAVWFKIESSENQFAFDFIVLMGGLVD